MAFFDSRDIDNLHAHGVRTLGDAAQLIMSLATLLGVCVSSYISLGNSRKMATVVKATDGIKTELVALTAKASKAEGNLEGRAELKEEQKS